MPYVQTRTLMKENIKKSKIPLYLSNEKSYVLEICNYPVGKQEKNGEKSTEKKHYF